MRLVAAVALILLAAGCSGSDEASFEDRVHSYLQTESRYRHTLDWRGEIRNVRCDEMQDVRAEARLCEITFAKAGVERWSVIPTGGGGMYLHPWGNPLNGGVAN